MKLLIIFYKSALQIAIEKDDINIIHALLSNINIQINQELIFFIFF